MYTYMYIHIMIIKDSNTNMVMPCTTPLGIKARKQWATASLGTSFWAWS